MPESPEEIKAANERSLANFAEFFSEAGKIRKIPVGEPLHRRDALVAATIDGFPMGERIAKTELESEIFYKKANGSGNPSLDYLADRGSLLHQLTASILDSAKKEFSEEKTLTRIVNDSRAYKRLAMDRFLNEGSLDAVASGSDVARARSLAENVTALVGNVKELYREVTIAIPVTARLHRQVGALSCRADAIVVGDKGTAIVDLKTGKRFDEGRLLFNLIFLALEWEVIRLVVPDKRYRVKWGGARIECRSPVSLAMIEPRLETTLAVVWPDFVVTNDSFRLSKQEVSQGVVDLNEKILDIFMGRRK